MAITPFRYPLADKLGIIARPWRNYIRSASFKEKQLVRITAASSPYNVEDGVEVVLCDTDSGAITVNLPAGAEGRFLQIKNVGSSGNDVTVVPDDAIFGDANFTLYDEEHIDIVWNSTEFWR